MHIVKREKWLQLSAPTTNQHYSKTLTYFQAALSYHVVVNSLKHQQGRFLFCPMDGLKKMRSSLPAELANKNIPDSIFLVHNKKHIKHRHVECWLSPSMLATLAVV